MSEIRFQTQYRQLCETEISIPLFCQAWWLDAVAGPEHWDVALVIRKSQIVAALPYVIHYKQGLKYLIQPPLSQFLGPWLRLPKAKYTKVKQEEKTLLKSLIAALPNFDLYQQNWSPQRDNWLPFYWQAYQQTTRYTYRLSLHSTSEIWAGLQENIRTDIRKAQNRYQLQVKSPTDLEAFLALIHMTFERQQITQPFSESSLKHLFQTCLQRNCARLFMAQDAEGQYHAGALIVWDRETTYYLLGGGNPDLRNSGAGSLCLWEAIQFAATQSAIFDFEGSMLEPVERYFRAFGAVQTPYFQVSKTCSRRLKIYKALKNLLDIWSKH